MILVLYYAPYHVVANISLLPISLYFTMNFMLLLTYLILKKLIIKKKNLTITLSRLLPKVCLVLRQVPNTVHKCVSKHVVPDHQAPCLVSWKMVSVLRKN